VHAASRVSARSENVLALTRSVEMSLRDRRAFRLMEIFGRRAPSPLPRILYVIHHHLVLVQYATGRWLGTSGATPVAVLLQMYTYS